MQVMKPWWALREQNLDGHAGCDTPSEGLANVQTELLQKDTFVFVLKCIQVQEQWDLWGETVTEETMYFGFAERGFWVVFFQID